MNVDIYIKNKSHFQICAHDGNLFLYFYYTKLILMYVYSLKMIEVIQPSKTGSHFLTSKNTTRWVK